MITAILLRKFLKISLLKTLLVQKTKFSHAIAFTPGLINSEENRVFTTAEHDSVYSE